MIHWESLFNDKFDTICEEHGGKIIHQNHLLVAPATCEIEDYDDFKAFSHWLNRQEKIPHHSMCPDTIIKGFNAEHNYQNREESFVMKFHVTDKKRVLSVEQKYSVDLQTFDNENDATAYWDRLKRHTDHMNEGLKKELREKCHIPDYMKKKYTAQITLFESDEPFDDTGEPIPSVEAKIKIPIKTNTGLYAIIDEMTETVQEMAKYTKKKLVDVSNRLR